MLDRYEGLRPEEAESVDRIRCLVHAHPDCFDRSCQPGHITASAWIVSHDQRRFLLTRHRKLRRWLQLGGHADGETRVEQVALREAQEESGMGHFDLVLHEGELLPVDVDVHEIPAYGPDPRHEHHDLRFVLIAGPNQVLRISHESDDLRWFDQERLEEVVTEPGIRRMALKALALLARS